MKPQLSQHQSKARRSKERGAALISVLLISTLLLTAGGVLILTTNMSATGAIDATAEMQAYYGAEAGLQSTLQALRFALPKITFKEAKTPADSNVSGDSATSSGIARLSKWLTYDAAYTDRIPLSESYNPYNGIAYSIRIVDPDNTPPSKSPSRLRIISTGYGPRGARKVLEMMILQSGLFGYSSCATVMMRGSDEAPPPALTFNSGSSNSVRYSGIDIAKPGDPGYDSTKAGDVPTFAVTSSDVTPTELGIQKSNQVQGPTPIGVIGSTACSPPWLESADTARDFVEDLRGFAQYSNPNRYFTTQPSASNVAGFTFMEGDMTMGPGNQGSGLLVVTGNLTMTGSTSFTGLIFVLGGGSVLREGTGNGVITGGIVVARFGVTGSFLAPTFFTDGGGNSTVQYSSSAGNGAAANLPSFIVLGVVER